MLRGAEGLIKVCKNKIHSEPHHVTADGNLSWEEVECLGSCVNAPMVQIFKDTYEDLTPEKLEGIIDDLAAGKKVKPGTQINRQHSAPEGGPVALTDKALYKGQRTFKRVEAPPPPPPAAPAAAPAAPAPAAAAPAAAPVAAAAPVKLVETPSVPMPKPAVPKVAPAPKIAVPARKAAPAPKAEKEDKPVIKSAAKAIEGRPELLAKPRGKADDLKLIWGVGPALEKLLNKIGVWHFEQVASWSAKELAWVDEKLEGFKGRAKRDEWIKGEPEAGLGLLARQPLARSRSMKTPTGPNATGFSSRSRHGAIWNWRLVDERLEWRQGCARCATTSQAKKLRPRLAPGKRNVGEKPVKKSVKK
jgi:NADH-quinone oxidoreductase subunit E